MHVCGILSLRNFLILFKFDAFYQIQENFNLKLELEFSKINIFEHIVQLFDTIVKITKR